MKGICELLSAFCLSVSKSSGPLCWTSANAFLADESYDSLWKAHPKIKISYLPRTINHFLPTKENPRFPCIHQDHKICWNPMCQTFMCEQSKNLTTSKRTSPPSLAIWMIYWPTVDFLSTRTDRLFPYGNGRTHAFCKGLWIYVKSLIGGIVCLQESYIH